MPGSQRRDVTCHEISIKSAPASSRPKKRRVVYEASPCLCQTLHRCANSSWTYTAIHPPPPAPSVSPRKGMSDVPRHHWDQLPRAQPGLRDRTVGKRLPEHSQGHGNVTEKPNVFVDLSNSQASIMCSWPPGQAATSSSGPTPTSSVGRRRTGRVCERGRRYGVVVPMVNGQACAVTLEQKECRAAPRPGGGGEPSSSVAVQRRRPGQCSRSTCNPKEGPHASLAPPTRTPGGEHCQKARLLDICHLRLHLHCRMFLSHPCGLRASSGHMHKTPTFFEIRAKTRRWSLAQTLISHRVPQSCNSFDHCCPRFSAMASAPLAAAAVLCCPRHNLVPCSVRSACRLGSGNAAVLSGQLRRTGHASAARAAAASGKRWLARHLTRPCGKVSLLVRESYQVRKPKKRLMDGFQPQLWHMQPLRKVWQRRQQRRPQQQAALESRCLPRSIST